MFITVIFVIRDHYLLLQQKSTNQQRRRQQQQKNFPGTRAHWFPCAVASSRRLNNKMPMPPMMPPSSKTICPKAVPSSVHEMLRPLLNASTGEKTFTRLMTVKKALNSGINTMSAAECPIAPVSPLPPTTVPASTASASVPLESTITTTAREKNAATGNVRKLAAINPNAANSAIQQKMIPRPRAKFRVKLPLGYST